MLVLSRKENETICIGDQITIHISHIKGSRVRVGIEAPSDVSIMRGELENWASEIDLPLPASITEHA
ncbi:MAG: carbon storage regulator [Pirellulaceae bacterium]|jgi:carbon storage regulator|nr:carbon storage regulator [Pirellulaceae bacterium]